MLHHKNPKSFDLGFFAWAVQDENRAAARSAVSNQPSGLLLSPRFPFFRNVYQGCTNPILYEKGFGYVFVYRKFCDESTQSGKQEQVKAGYHHDGGALPFTVYLV